MKYVDVDATVELQVNLAQLTDNTDFKSIEAAIAYNESGMDLKWHFQTTSGVMATPASVTPTTGGDYDWNHSNGGMYKIEVPASGGASINNDTEGYGYFSGSCDGVLAWVGPTYCFRAAATNNALINAASLLVELAKAVWDRVLNGSTHNIPSSAGRRLRSTGDALAGTVDDASATTLSFITDLTGGYTDFYADQVIHFTTGNLAGMTRIIVSFNNATKEVVLDEALPVAPADTDEFEVHPDHIHSVSSMISSMLNTVVDGTYNIAKSWGKRLIGIEEYQGYKGGFIYIDTLNGEAGSDPHVNGVVDKKVNNLADALLLAAALNMYDFQVAAGSSLVFASSQDNNSYHGHNWTLGLGGRSINSTYIHGAIDISGIATASEPPKFEHCILNGTILPPLLAVSCGLGGDMIANAAGEYVYQDCYSKVAGFGTPSFDSGVALANVNLSVRNYSGGIELKNMGQVGIDKATVEGEGQVVINDNCVGSAGSQIAMRGHQERYGGDPFEAG
ncbi:MAG: hypothetical protein KAJ19_10245, partial [Gammaproteobacteria bacterium]|nr:hypothetical protein [Gammaproteobacteria bacterium]